MFDRVRQPAAVRSARAVTRFVGDRTALVRQAERLVASWWFAYPVIFLLQLHVMWKVWSYKDTTSGDTSYYFLEALNWVHGLHDDVALSPLYTDYFGTIVAAIKDVPTAILVHRLLIVFAASLLALALMRSLLGPAVGLLV